MRKFANIYVKIGLHLAVRLFRRCQNYAPSQRRSAASKGPAAASCVQPVQDLSVLKKIQLLEEFLNQMSEGQKAGQILANTIMVNLLRSDKFKISRFIYALYSKHCPLNKGQKIGPDMEVRRLHNEQVKWLSYCVDCSDDHVDDHVEGTPCREVSDRVFLLRYFLKALGIQDAASTAQGRADIEGVLKGLVKLDGSSSVKQGYFTGFNLLSSLDGPAWEAGRDDIDALEDSWYG